MCSQPNQNTKKEQFRGCWKKGSSSETVWQLQMAAHLSGVQSESLRIYMAGGGGGFFNNGSLIAVVVVVVKTGRRQKKCHIL